MKTPDALNDRDGICKKLFHRVLPGRSLPVSLALLSMILPVGSLAMGCGFFNNLRDIINTAIAS